MLSNGALLQFLWWINPRWKYFCGSLDAFGHHSPAFIPSLLQQRYCQSSWTPPTFRWCHSSVQFDRSGVIHLCNQNLRIKDLPEPMLLIWPVFPRSFMWSLAASVSSLDHTSGGIGLYVFKNSIASIYASGPSSVSIAVQPSAVFKMLPINRSIDFSSYEIKALGLILILFWSLNISFTSNPQSIYLMAYSRLSICAGWTGSLETTCAANSATAHFSEPAWSPKATAQCLFATISKLSSI